LFCGIPPASDSCAGAAGALDVLGALEEEFDELELPQPATIRAMASSAPHAILRLAFPVPVIVTSILVMSKT
jgi:hypothetical protein